LAPLQSLATTVVIAIFVITFIMQAFEIPSGSMEDTLLVGDYLLADKVQFGDPGHFGFLLPYRKIQRGDVVVFRWPVHPQEHFVKRVVGVPGDHIKIVGGHVFVNGQLEDETHAIYRGQGRDDFRDNFPMPYRASPQMTADWFTEVPKLTHNGELLVPEDHYFVLGDNRNDSQDSRYWGLVPRQAIIASPLAVYWSLRQPPLAELNMPPDDKLGRFWYELTHLPQLMRWDRVFHIVR